MEAAGGPNSGRRAVTSRGRIVLCGGLALTFAEITRHFFEALDQAGNGRVVLLLQGGPTWARYVARYRDPWLDQTKVDVVPVAPGTDGKLAMDDHAALEACSGIFMGGGDTEAYRQSFVSSPTGKTIRAKVAAGVPYGGVSAGAILAGAAGTGGLDLLPNLVIEPHFDEGSGRAALDVAMERAGVRTGLGLGEAVGVSINGDEAAVDGQGHLVVVRRLSDRLEEFAVSPGETVRLTPSR